VEEVVFEVVSWREGYFSFAEGSLEGLRTEAEIRIPTEAVLMEGARRIDEWSRIERHITHLGVVPSLAPVDDDLHGALDLLPSEWELLALIDGDRDLRGIAAALGRSEFDVAKIVFGLATSGVITLRDPQAGQAPAKELGLPEQLAHVATLLDAGELEAARLEAEALATSYNTEPAVHVLAARAALRSGRPRDAEAAARRALALEPLLLDGHRLVGDSLMAQGRLGEAVEWLGRWLALDRKQGSEDGSDREVVIAAIAAARTLDSYLRGRSGG